MMLPNGWKKVKLGQIMSFKNGLNFSQVSNGKELNFLGVANFKSRKFISSEAQLDKIYLADFPNDDYLLKTDDLVFVRSNGSKDLVGRCVKMNDTFSKTTFSGFCIRGRLSSSETTADYILHFIECGFLKDKLKRESRGTNISNLNQDILDDFDIMLPPLEEQKKIAATLSVWDSAIEKMEKLIEAKENAKQFFFYKLVTENSCLWEIKKLSDFLTPGNKTPVLNTSLYRKVIVKLHKKGLEFNTQTREMADTRPFYIRNEGELIIGKQNYFNGSIAMVDKEHDQCICSNAIMSFSIKDIHPLYLYEYISDEEYLKKHSMLANGTGQKELSEKDFLNFEIRVPKRKQQDEIACVLNNCNLEIFLLHAQLENYKKQKQGLMQKLLTGEWRVK